MTKIYLIRHAEAEGNYYRRIQGQWDGGITPRGFRQIDALALRMRDIPLDALYSSDLRRTMLTAQAIQQYHDLPLTTDPRLREVHMGVWEGMSWGDVIHAYGQQYEYFSSNPDLWHIEGAEDWNSLRERMYTAITDIAARHEGGSVAIVSHGTAIRALMCKLLNVPGKDIHSVPHGDNTCITLLEVDGGSVRICYACDNTHLSEDLSSHKRQTWWRTGKDTGNLRFRPLNLKTEGKFYLRCYADAWQIAHGDTEGFVPALYLMSANRWLTDHPEAIAVALEEDQIVGIAALDTHRGAEEGKGWVSFLYLLPQHRGKRYGIQLLGYAATLYAGLGRRHLCLSVSEDNIHARGFYEHAGFTKIGEAVGIGAPLHLMEKPLSGGVLPLPSESYGG